MVQRLHCVYIAECVHMQGQAGNVGEITRGYATKQFAFEAIKTIEPKGGAGSRHKRKAEPEPAADLAEHERPSKRRCPGTGM